MAGDAEDLLNVKSGTHVLPVAGLSPPSAVKLIRSQFPYLGAANRDPAPFQVFVLIRTNRELTIYVLQIYELAGNMKQLLEMTNAGHRLHDIRKRRKALISVNPENLAISIGQQ